MIVVENECVGCPKEIGCIGSTCPYNSVTHYYCDECGCEATLYDTEWGEICSECLMKKYSIVDGSEYI